VNAPKVRRISSWFAYGGCTLDMLVERTRATEGIVYRDPLRDSRVVASIPSCAIRAYIGEVNTRDNGILANTSRLWTVPRLIESSVIGWAGLPLPRNDLCG